MKCPICQQRAGKRFCPAKNAYICAVCCGESREITIECPFECQHLLDSYRFENHAAPATLAYEKHAVDEEFVQKNAQLVNLLAMRLLRAGLQNGLVDVDLRAVIDALVRTWETTSSGLIYETLPESLPRTAAFRDIQQVIDEYRKEETQQTGMTTLRDTDVLRALAFLGRVAQTHDNHRARGKSFLAFLRHMFPETTPAQRAPTLIVPGA